MQDDLFEAGAPRTHLAAVQPPDMTDEQLAHSLAELRRLGKTLGFDVVGAVTQRRAAPDTAAYLGPGRVKELAETIAADAAEHPERRQVVLLDDEATPSQSRNLARATGAQVLDRTAVILEIFHRHAKSREARMQVEIVRLEYMAPRLRELRKGGGRQQGGIGGKGAGETARELDRRNVRDRIAELRRELTQLESDRATQRARRGELRRVALVGYTNAGKSTLMRALTGTEVYVADKLFATLDTTVRALQPETTPRVLVSDTVGFIEKLPHQLVASFKSTLDEAREASLLLHVVDASDPAHERQLAATRAVLAEIGAADIPSRLVLNKIDRVPEPDRPFLAVGHPDALLVSAKDPADVAVVRDAILAFFEGQEVEDEVMVPHDRPRVRAALFAEGTVLEERYDERGGVFRVRATPAVLARLRAALS